MITNWKLYGDYGFIKNIIIFMLIPFIGIILLMKLFYRNVKITNELFDKYDYKKMINEKIQNFMMNIPNIIMNNNLTMDNIINYIWSDKDISLLNEINKYDEEKNKYEIKFQLLKIGLEIMIIILIIYQLLNSSYINLNNSKILYIILIGLYIIVRMIMIFIKITYPSLSSFIISEYFTKQYKNDKNEFYLGMSIVNITLITIMSSVIYIIKGYKDIHKFGWYIILIISLFVYNLVSSIYSIKKLYKWKKLEINDINLLLINYLLINKQKSKKNEKVNLNELKFILIEGIRNSVNNLFNIVSDDDKVRNEIVSKTIKSLDKTALQKLFKDFGYSINDIIDDSNEDDKSLLPDVNIINGDKTNYDKWKDVNKECFNDIKIQNNLLSQFSLWIWNFEDVLIDTNSFYRMKMKPDEIRALTDEQLDLQVPHWKYYKSLVKELIKNGKYVAICSFGVDFIIDAYMSRIFGYNQKYFKIGVNIKTIPRHNITGEPNLNNIITNKIPFIKELMDNYRINNFNKVIMFDNSIQNLACVREVGIIGIKIGENDRSIKLINELNPNNLFHGGMIDYISQNLNDIIENNKKTRYNSIGILKVSRRDKQKQSLYNNDNIDNDNDNDNDNTTMNINTVITKLKCKNDNIVEEENNIVEEEDIIEKINKKNIIEEEDNTENNIIKEELKQYQMEIKNNIEKDNDNINNIYEGFINKCDKCNNKNNIQIILILIIIIIFITYLRNNWHK